MHRLIRGLSFALLLAAATDAAAAGPVRVALIGDAGGFGEAGFRLGLDVSTGGNGRIRGRQILLGTDTPDITVAFGPAETMRPLLAEARRILLLADSSATGNRFVFGLGPDPEQMASALALTLSRPELNLLVATEDTADAVETATALKRRLGQHNDSGFFVGIRRIPAGTADVGALLSPEFEGLHDLHGSHTLLTVWTAPPAPIASIAAAGSARAGVGLALAGALDPNALPDVTVTGVTSYYPSFPHSPLNDRLVATWRRRFHALPDEAAAAGMTAALAVAAALKASRSTDSDALIHAFEGLRFQTPKGAVVIDPDHRARQALYQFRATPGKPPALEHEYSISALSPPDR